MSYHTYLAVPGASYEELITKCKNSKTYNNETGLHLSTVIHDYINYITNEHRRLLPTEMTQTMHD